MWDRSTAELEPPPGVIANCLCSIFMYKQKLSGFPNAANAFLDIPSNPLQPDINIIPISLFMVSSPLYNLFGELMDKYN